MENNKNHILIVDDDDRIRNLLKDYLSENNYIVSTAINAENAKEKLQYLKFDIRLMATMTIMNQLQKLLIGHPPSVDALHRAQYERAFRNPVCGWGDRPRRSLP